MRNKIIVFLIPICIILFCLFSLRSFFNPGFFPMHDDTQVARVNQMTKALMDGMFPVRIVQDLGYGYGYPIFNFYAPFAYYVGSFFDLIGFDEIVSSKIMVGVAFVILGLGMYLLSSKIFGKAGGVISSMIAVASPYIALNIFVRGAFAELYGIAFIPLIFYSILQISAIQKFRYVVLGCFAFAGMITSHNLTALMVTPFIVVMLLVLFFVHKKNKKIISFLIITIVFGLLLSAFYWLPAIGEMSLTNVSGQIGGGADFREHFVCVSQLWESLWGFGGSTPGCMDGMSFRIGKIHILFVLLSIPLIVLAKQKKLRYAVGGGLAVFIASVFFTLPQSQFVWEGSRVMEYFQYPWRFLGPLSLSSAFLAGAVVSYPRMLFKKKKHQNLALGGIISLTFLGVLLLYSKLFQPQSFLHVSSDYYTNPNTIRFQTSKISDEYLPKDFIKPIEPQSVPSETFTLIEGDGRLSSQIMTTDFNSVRFKGDESTIIINKAYAQYWHVSVDRQEASTQNTETGLLLHLPKGDHFIEVTYRNTPLQILGNILTVIGILGLFVGIILGRRMRLL